MANNPYVNKVVYGGQTLIDISDTTATADKILQGYTAYGADGQKLTGTATGSGGSVTQDQDGFIILPPTGGGGGGGSSYELLTSQEFTVSTTSTSNITVGTIATGASAYTSDKILYVKIRDKAGQKINQHYGSDSFFANPYPKISSSTTSSTRAILTYYVNDVGKMGVSSTAYGVYANSVNSSGDIVIYARYSSSNSHTIDGTFKCDVYLLDWVGDVSPFVEPLT